MARSRAAVRRRRLTRFTKLLGVLFALAGAVLAPGGASAVVVFSEGMLTPETISRVPAGFGALAGAYLVPDAARNLGDPALNVVWIVPEAGGAPSVFSGGHPDVLLAGLFLPANWGEHAGRYLTVGRETVGDTLIGVAHVYEADGSRALFGSYADAPFNQALIAPAGFGDLGGLLGASEEEAGGRINVVSPDGTLAHFADSALMAQAFGLAFAPAAFGAVGGMLLASDPLTGAIVAFDAAGNAALFADVPLIAGQAGLRQMAFTPPDFLADLGIPGELLLVSVSGSLNGGGTLGDVVAIDATGAVVASLRVAEAIDKFDPRGMYFRSDGSLLVSDSADPILLVTADDFRLGRWANVPAPGVPLLLAAGWLGMTAARRRGANRT